MANRYGSIKYFIVGKFFCCLIARLLFDQVIQLHNDFNFFQHETHTHTTLLFSVVKKLLEYDKNKTKQNQKQFMSELSRYSVTNKALWRKCAITFCLGGKVSFYFIKISHSYYHLTSWCSFHSHFLPLWRLGVYVWAPEDFLLWKRSKICVPFRSLNFEHA